MKGRKEMLNMFMIDYKKYKIWQDRLFHQSTYRTLPHLRQKWGIERNYFYMINESVSEKTHMLSDLEKKYEVFMGVLLKILALASVVFFFLLH